MIPNKDTTLLAQPPIDYLNNMKGDKHIVMFDENEEYLKIIQFHFLKIGLENGEIGIYAMPENEKRIEKEMSEFGIDVEKFKEENLLSIYCTSSIDHKKNAFDILLRKIRLSEITKSCRIVGMLDYDKKVKEGMNEFLESEKKSHYDFENFSGSRMCPYKVFEIEAKNRMKWIKELIKNHHSVIFTSSNNKGIAFDTS